MEGDAYEGRYLRNVMSVSQDVSATAIQRKQDVNRKPNISTIIFAC